MNPTKLGTINQAQADKALSSTRHQEMLAHTDYVANVVLSATSSLIEYLQGHTANVEVTNPVTSVATPDIDGVVKALQVVDTTLRSQEIVDVSPVVDVLKSVLEAVSALPQSIPEVHIPDSVIVSNQVDNTAEFTKLEEAIKALKLTAEAPIVNVPETSVHVDAPDLSPLSKDIKSVTSQVKLSREDMQSASAKSASGLITERFDEYKITYSNDDFHEQEVISSISYLYQGKQVAKLKYTYNSSGDLVGGKKL